MADNVPQASGPILPLLSITVSTVLPRHGWSLESLRQLARNSNSLCKMISNFN